MKLFTVAARLVLTGAVGTTLAVAQAPQAFAHCGIPSLHAALKEVRAMEADPRFASVQAQLSAFENQLEQIARQAIQLEAKLGNSVKTALAPLVSETAVVQRDLDRLRVNTTAVTSIRG
jgi:septal ring factor EnvC (AmiA/AmiB activator)